MSELSFTIVTERIKLSRNIAYKECEGSLQGELQTTAQGNKRGHKQIEKHQYCENGHTAQSNL